MAARRSIPSMAWSGQITKSVIAGTRAGFTTGGFGTPMLRYPVKEVSGALTEECKPSDKSDGATASLHPGSQEGAFASQGTSGTECEEEDLSPVSEVDSSLVTSATDSEDTEERQKWMEEHIKKQQLKKEEE